MYTEIDIMPDELKDGGILTITDEKSKNASVGAPRPVIPSSLCLSLIHI